MQQISPRAMFATISGSTVFVVGGVVQVRKLQRVPLTDWFFFPSLAYFLLVRFEVWTVMLNAMCPAELAARGAYAVWEGNLCSGTEAHDHGTGFFLSVA